MTGEQLIGFIKKYHLEKENIIPRDISNNYDGDYLRFTCPDEDVDYITLWLTDDYLQDIIFNHEGDRTYGKFSEAEKEFYFYVFPAENTSQKNQQTLIYEEDGDPDLYKAFLEACEVIGCDSKNATRTFNTLKRNRTVDMDLSEIPDETFLKMRTIGPRSVEIIRIGWNIYKGHAE